MDTRLAKRNYSIQQWKAIIQDRNNTNLTRFAEESYIGVI